MAVRLTERLDDPGREPDVAHEPRALRPHPVDLRRAAILGILVFATLSTLLVHRTASAPGFHMPPLWYDAQDYENMNHVDYSTRPV